MRNFNLTGKSQNCKIISFFLQKLTLKEMQMSKGKFHSQSGLLGGGACFNKKAADQQTAANLSGKKSGNKQTNNEKEKEVEVKLAKPEEEKSNLKTQESEKQNQEVKNEKPESKQKEEEDQKQEAQQNPIKNPEKAEQEAEDQNKSNQEKQEGGQWYNQEDPLRNK